MGFIKRMYAGWKSMTPVEKFKFALSTLTQIGAGIAVSNVAYDHAKDCGKVQGTLALIGGWGLGIAAGDVAGKAVEDFVDKTILINEMRKEIKKEDAQTAQQ